ncbi:hypothetical protein KRX19_01390 [Cardiobacteriaceae bacterium TAE3-ERU3]|nr:hypothetical protein [Cardiobacteriaceae bacterium TAE3-ERU3]
MKKIIALLSLAFAFTQAPALAAPIFVGTAEKIVKVADLPDIPELELAPNQYLDVGYCYEQFQLIFIPVWNYNEHYCGYVSDDTYTETSKEELLEISSILEADTSWDNDDPKIPMTDRVWGKVGLVALLLMFIAYQASKNKKSARREDPTNTPD